MTVTTHDTTPRSRRPRPTATRIAEVLDGFPGDAVTELGGRHLARLAVDLDALGRLRPPDREPCIDRHTLRSLLARACGPRAAEQVVAFLDDLPGCAFRHEVRPPAEEVAWFGLAREVVILDGSPAVAFDELRLRGHAHADVVAAVHARFPSMEPELLDAAEIPPRLVRLLHPEQERALDALLRAVVRQLGWWAALMVALLCPTACAAESGAALTEPSALAANVWPLGMYLYGAGVGGWTLTVVGDCILAEPR